MIYVITICVPKWTLWPWY